MALAPTEQRSSDKRRERVMDQTQTLDMVVLDTVLDKVELALGLVDRAGQELNDALTLEPGSDGLTQIEAMLYQAAARLRCELRSQGGPATACPQDPRPSPASSPAASAASPPRSSRSSGGHFYGVHLGAVV